jgi:hypothetical protein
MRNVPTVISRQNRPIRTPLLHVKMGLENLDFKNVKRYLGKVFRHILKANDMEHFISQIQPDWIILKAQKREMKTPLLTCILYPLKHSMFSFLV